MTLLINSDNAIINSRIAIRQLFFEAGRLVLTPAGRRLEGTEPAEELTAGATV